MGPPSGHNLICKNLLLAGQCGQSDPRGVSEKCQSFSCICMLSCQHILGSAPPPSRCSACSYLVIYFQAQTVNNGGEQTTTTEPKNAPPLPTSKRRNKRTDEKKQCKKKGLDRARDKTIINIGTSFRGGGVCRICKDSSAGQVRTACLIYVSFSVLTARLWWRRLQLYLR